MDPTGNHISASQFGISLKKKNCKSVSDVTFSRVIKQAYFLTSGEPDI